MTKEWDGEFITVPTKRWKKLMSLIEACNKLILLPDEDLFDLQDKFENVQAALEELEKE